MIFTLVCLLYLLLPFQVALNPAAGFDVASVRVIVPVLALAWLIHGLASRKLSVPPRIQTPLLLSFLFLSAFSLINAHETAWGLRKLLFLFSFFPLYFVLAAVVTTEEKILRLTKYIVFGSFVLALAGIFQFLLQFAFSLDTLSRVWTRTILPPFLGSAFAQSVADYPSLFVNVGGHTLMRTVAVFPDPHMLSFYLGMTAPLAIGIALAIPKRRYIFFIMATTILLADVLTFSRGGYLGLAAGLAFLLATQQRYWSWRAKKIALAIMVACVVILLATPVGTRFFSSFNAQEGSNQGRIAMWRAATDIVIEHPWLGVGLGNYSLTIKPSAEYRDPIYAHDLFLDIAAETGIINAIIFIALILVSVAFLQKNAKVNTFFIWPAASLVIFTAHSLVETPLYSVHVVPLLLFLLAISARWK